MALDEGGRRIYMAVLTFNFFPGHEESEENERLDEELQLVIRRDVQYHLPK